MLKVMGRDGNSLSGVIRDAWDGGDLAPMTKHESIRATHPHIVIVGHVTREELVKHLRDTEKSNGFGNRFVWLAVRRSKLLPFPGDIDVEQMKAIKEALRDAVGFSENVKTLRLTTAGRCAWRTVYPALSEGKPGTKGALLGRAEAQVMRLAALYALLDQESTIDAHHIQAALALWQYSEDSVEWIFSEGESVEQTIRRAIFTNGRLSDTEISKLFSGNLPGDVLDRVKKKLERDGVMRPVTESSGGRPRRVWVLCTK